MVFGLCMPEAPRNTVMAMGFAIVYRTMGLVNFAHAGFGAVGAYVFWNLYPDHVPLIIALAAMA